MTYEAGRVQPRSKFAAAAGENRRGGTGPPQGSQPVVLLVEDNRNLRVTTTRMLEHLGYRVIAVADGREAVRAYREASPAPDVVILDVIMPGMSGKETLDAIRASAPGARIVMCSGSAEELARAVELDGATAAMAKPYDMDLLATTLRRVLERG